jgi:hypothetical protein
MNTLEDPQVRYYRRIGAVLCIAVTTAFVAGVSYIGATSRTTHPLLAVNCAVEGAAGSVFDDSGAHAALCAGHAPATRRQHAAHAVVPPPAPSSDATAEPHPATF